ncbi:transposase [Symbiopectobacterium sp. RP]|uniref:transposase n=1 Tax=Symbiopectobacterium sp. RP TaxID=3248553 RepID=UPI003D2B9CF1
MDESGFSHDTPRTHGYSPKGQRCFGLKNGGAKGRTNVIGALLGTTLFAIGLFDININSDVFYSWVTQVLIPVLPKNRVMLISGVRGGRGGWRILLIDFVDDFKNRKMIPHEKVYPTGLRRTRYCR